jgi:hypothetical protein
MGKNMHLRAKKVVKNTPKRHPKDVFFSSFFLKGTILQSIGRLSYYQRNCKLHSRLSTPHRHIFNGFCLNFIFYLKCQKIKIKTHVDLKFQSNKKRSILFSIIKADDSSSNLNQIVALFH